MQTSYTRSRSIRGINLLGGLLFAGVCAAHHSPAMLYDLSQEITIEGIVTEYVLGNPHLRIYFDVDNDGTGAGGGLYGLTSSTTMTNTIVAKNYDKGGPIYSIQYSIQNNE